MRTAAPVGLALAFGSLLACAGDGAEARDASDISPSEDSAAADSGAAADSSAADDDGCDGARIGVIEGATVVPQSIVHLAVMTDGRFVPVGYRWTASPPEGGVVTFAPSAASPSPEVALDVGGDYRFSVALTDARGAVCNVSIPVAAASDVEVRVQLTWRAPGDPQGLTRPGADLDLHVLHPAARGAWLDRAWDCWVNGLPSPSWGIAGRPPWCEMTRDDFDVPGPETILVHPDGESRFTVGVHAHRDASAPMIPTIAIWIRGALADRWEGPALAPDELWASHVIDWPAGLVTRVEPRELVPDITEGMR